MRLILSLSLLLALSACGGRAYTSRWDGRRGYGGSGDYGYDMATERAEARGYRAHASRNYPRPGPPEDPWRPYIQQAAQRFRIPERWVREVMHQESGGHLTNGSGGLTTSPVGAMGLMQVMPGTYAVLRRHYGLGDDPYEPHDNIMAGSAYIREMYDRYGSPGFLAAYNAGPQRVDSYLAGSTELPDETVHYVQNIAPRLGTEVAMSGPLAPFGDGGGNAAYQPPVAMGAAQLPEASDPADRAYSGGGMSGVNYYSGNRDVVARDETAAPAPVAPRPAPPIRYAMAAPAPMPDEYASVPPPRPQPRLFASAQAAERLPLARSVPPTLTPVAAPGSAGSGWAVQVGAFPDPGQSRAYTDTARSLSQQLAGTQAIVAPVQHGSATLYRARLVGLSPERAAAACTSLIRRGMACMTVSPGN